MRCCIAADLVEDFPLLGPDFLEVLYLVLNTSQTPTRHTRARELLSTSFPRLS